jgi:aspartyl-tRNA(Asn)/glutamyl-tRNA(Gln) amidotransferase subunit A
MARSAWDCAAMLAVFAGYDPTDACCLDKPVDDYLSALDGSLEGLTIGVERAHHLYGELVDPTLIDVFEAAVKMLEAAGAKVTEVSIPLYQELTDATMLGWPGEAGAYHLKDLQTRWNDFGAATRMVLVAGVLVSSADYAQCQRVRRVGQKQVASIMQDVDLIVTPTTATGAPLVAGLDFAGLISSIFTPIWNATGHPALSVPMGFTAGGLPLGLQIVGRPLDEATVLQAGDAFQHLTDWHLRLPALTQDHQPALG